MRVALISPLSESVPPKLYGGTERVVYNLCRGLQAAGVEVTLFASGDSTVNTRLIAGTESSFRLADVPVSDPVPYYLRMMAMVRRYSHEFDIIHNHNDYWMLPLSEMVRTPLVTTLHGQLDLPDICAAFMSYRNCAYISISDAQRRPLPHLSWAKTIYHGMNVEDFEFHPQPGRYLAFLGRISAQKRPDWAIEIARRAGVPLKIAAKIEGREMQEYYEQRVKPHVDGNFIEYIGEISDHEKSEFLGNALGMVFPIDWPEPFGLVVTEALACGTPVLARPFGSMPELLQEGVTGYCHTDLDILADHVKNLSRIDRAGCRRYVAEKFSLKKMVEEHVDVYRELIEAGPAGIPSRRPERAVGDRRHFLHSV